MSKIMVLTGIMCGFLCWKCEAIFSLARNRKLNGRIKKRRIIKWTKSTSMSMNILFNACFPLCVLTNGICVHVNHTICMPPIWCTWNSFAYGQYKFEIRFQIGINKCTNKRDELVNGKKNHTSHRIASIVFYLNGF